MKAVILAGGKGTRMYPITLEYPKPLLTVKRKPIISYLVELFWKFKVTQVIVSIHQSQRADFEWWIKRYHPKQRIVLTEEKKPLGTFGGLFRARKYLKNEEDFFVTNGDEIKKIDLRSVIRAHKAFKAEGALATVVLVQVENPKNYGVALLRGDAITGFLEKPHNPPSRWVNSGLYVMNHKILDYYSSTSLGTAMLEKDLFPKLADAGRLFGFKARGLWLDCGNVEGWERAIKSKKL